MTNSNIDKIGKKSEDNCIWKAHKGQQEFALSIDDSIFEILYGGARGSTTPYH